MAYTLLLDHCSSRPAGNRLLRHAMPGTYFPDCHSVLVKSSCAPGNTSADYPPFLEPVPVSVNDIRLSDFAGLGAACCRAPKYWFRGGANWHTNSAFPPWSFA